MWFVAVEVEQETSAPPPKKNPGSAPVRSHGTKTTRLGIVCSVVGQTGLPSKMVIYVTCGSPLLHVKEPKTFWYSGFQSMYFRILNTGFQSLSAELGFRIPSAVFRIPKPMIPEFHKQNFPESGFHWPNFRGLLHGAVQLQELHLAHWRTEVTLFVWISNRLIF